MGVSEQLLGFAESAYESGDIPNYVYNDMKMFAIDVKDVERARDERHVVTANEHSRVVSVYIDALADKNATASKIGDENTNLRKLVYDMSIQFSMGDVDCGICPHYDSCWDSETLEFSPDGCKLMNMARELGIEVRND